MHTHQFDCKIVDNDYLKSEATCTSPTQYYYRYCSICGQRYTLNTFFVETLGEHDYSQENTNAKYLKSEATREESAVYYDKIA